MELGYLYFFRLISKTGQVIGIEKKEGESHEVKVAEAL